MSSFLKGFDRIRLPKPSDTMTDKATVRMTQGDVAVLRQIVAAIVKADASRDYYLEGYVSTEDLPNEQTISDLADRIEALLPPQDSPP